MDHDTENEVPPRTDNPGLNDEIDKTVEINSEVRPEQYPKEDRAQQTAVAASPKAQAKPTPRT